MANNAVQAPSPFLECQLSIFEQIALSVNEVFKPRPLNCDTNIGVVGSWKRCPHCRQFHLRPCYCQALDPINKDKFPEVWAKQPEVASDATDNQQNAQNHRAETEETAKIAVATDNVQPEVSNATDNVCVVCGATFQAKRSDAKYCSSTCRSKAYRQ